MRSSERLSHLCQILKHNNIIAALRNAAARTCTVVLFIDLNMVRARVVTHTVRDGDLEPDG
jgi:hypothetical protein